MSLATKIKLFFVILCVLALWQEHIAAPKVFLFFALLSLLFFLIVRLSLKFFGRSKEAGASAFGNSQLCSSWSRKFSSFFDSSHSSLFLYLPILLFLFFVRLVLLPDPIIPPDGWYGEELSPKRISKTKKLYVRGNITSVLRPGVYVAELEIIKAKKRGLKQNSGLKVKEKKPPLIPVYLQINDYYLVSACRVWLTLKGRGLPQKIPQNSFGQYIRNKGAVSMLRLSRKDIYRKDCRHQDLRGKFQNMLGRTLYKSGFSLHERGVALGLLLGRSGYMQRGLKKKAVELGILHLFAASGLHMGIFYLCFYYPLSRWRGKKSKIALALPLLPCFAYMFFLSFPVSLVRAFTFLSFHALQSFLYRKIKIHDLLLNSALALLFLQPHNFLGLGTSLSFGAVSGILYFYPILWREFSRIQSALCRPLLQQLAISVCAGLFTLPILLYSFGAYSYSSLVANVILVPFVGILMPLLIAGIALAALSGDTLLFLAQIARQLTDHFISLTQYFSDFSFYIPYRSMLSLPFFVNLLLLFSLMVLGYYNKRKNKAGKKPIFFAAASVFCILLLSPLSGILEKHRKRDLKKLEKKKHTASLEFTKDRK